MLQRRFGKCDHPREYKWNTIFHEQAGSIFRDFRLYIWKRKVTFLYWTRKTQNLSTHTTFNLAKRSRDPCRFEAVNLALGIKIKTKKNFDVVPMSKIASIKLWNVYSSKNADFVSQAIQNSSSRPFQNNR